MNPERLLQYFEQISDAPDAIPRLRKFILDLAVRGKLVEQDPKDESALELLKQIDAEKARLIKAGEIRKLRSPLSIDEETTLFVPPASWKWVPIRKITTDRGQKIPDKDFSYIDVSAIDKERGKITEPQVLAPDAAPSRARKIVKIGDVIYSCVRPYLLNIAVVDEEYEPEPIVSTAFAVLNGFGMILPRYLWIVLRSPFFVVCVEEKMRGQAYPAINDRDFAPLPFPLPPLAEQHRIVAKVDELMTLCDQLEAAQTRRESRRDRLVAATLNGLNNGDTDPENSDRATFAESTRFYLKYLARLTTRPEHIKQLRQAVLNLAVRGKLIPQDPKDEPASKLLARVSEWRIEAIQNKIIRAPRRPLKEIDDLRETPYVLPNGWAWARLGEVLYIQSGDGLIAANMKDGNIPVYGGNGVNGYHNAFNVAEPTIVIGRVGYYCGSIHVTPERAWITDNAFITKFCSQEIFLEFLVLLLRSTNLKENENATAQPVISGSKIYPIVIAMPPLAEQHRIVAKVDELMTLCDVLEVQINSTTTTRRQLLEATLHEALAS